MDDTSKLNLLYRVMRYLNQDGMLQRPVKNTPTMIYRLSCQNEEKVVIDTFAIIDSELMSGMVNPGFIDPGLERSKGILWVAHQMDACVSYSRKDRHLLVPPAFSFFNEPRFYTFKVDLEAPLSTMTHYGKIVNGLLVDEETI